VTLCATGWSQTRSTIPSAKPAKRPVTVQDTAARDTVKPASSLADWATTWLRFGSHTDTAYAKIASLQLGFNFYLKKNTMFLIDTVRNMGFLLALGVPVRIPYLVAWGNVKFLAHGVGLAVLKRPGDYFTVSNELMIGKNFVLLGQPIEYIPHIGIGYDNGIVVGPVDSSGTGIKGYQTHYYMHMNIGLLARKSFEFYGVNTNIGLTLNYEFAFLNNKGEDTKERLNLSLVGSY
jgi:hypothetical protein